MTPRRLTLWLNDAAHELSVSGVPNSELVEVTHQAGRQTVRVLRGGTEPLVLVDGRVVRGRLVSTGTGGELSVAGFRSRVERGERRTTEAKRDGKPRDLTAPMPGRVVAVLVRPGDEVCARQPLLVIEAMKMQNELVASGDGRVEAVLVAAGVTVERGALLLRFATSS
jgi:biotin carboxyl carrier protein